MKRLLAVPLAIFMLLFAAAVCLGMIHTTNFIYEVDIRFFGLIDDSGYSPEEAEMNVESVLDYLSPFSDKEFDLPTLEYSPEGASHFKDCKVVFNGLYLLGLISFVGLLVMFIWARPDKVTRRIAAVIMLLLPLTVLAAMAVDFDRTFVIFHELLFSNSDWIFNPITDPIIIILPSEFFMHCGIFIALVIVLSALLLCISFKRKKPETKKRYVNGDMTERPLLEQIDSAGDLKRLADGDVPRFAEEIRDFLVEKVNVSGGHLASNLGIVEATLAIHRNFDTPKDHVIWDVGHQSYVHKIITGRKKDFDELRTPGGLSGFTKISESEHDCFGAGHSSTSLSAALGFAQSDKAKGSDAYTVVVLGDGAFTGGMIHEAMNNISRDLRLIILLNENEMSISKNKGGFAEHLSDIRTTKKYFKFKAATENTLEHIPLIGKPTARLIHRIKKRLKNFFYSTNYFEDMGLYYMGPVDGNDYKAVNDMIQVAKKLECSTIIHLNTKKGYGYKPAEDMPQHYHAVPKGGVTEEKEGFSENLGKAVYEIAKYDKTVCAITAAMPHGTGLEIIKHKLPDQFYDVGIAEEHAATFAAGLCANGMIPYFACYSSFLQRAYDNIVHDIALQRLPVILCIDRCGLNEGDGATHHGIFDVSFLSAVPDIEIYTPATYDCLKECVEAAHISGCSGAIRYPRGGEREGIKKAFYPDGCTEVSVAVSDNACHDAECVIITYGNIAAEALKAEGLFSDMGIKCSTILLEKIKPYDKCAEKVISLIPKTCRNIIFLEEGIRNGGASLCLWDKLNDHPALSDIRYSVCAIDDDFIRGEKGKTLLESAHLTAEDVLECYKKQNNL